MLKAITFDFWNTLYISMPDLRISSQRVNAMQNALRSLGHERLDEDVTNGIKEAWKLAHHKQRQEGIDIAPRGQLNFILEKLAVSLKKEEWERLYQVYTDVLIDLPPSVNEGLLEILPLLADKYKLAVICNTGVTPGVVLRDIMKKDKIFDFFQLTVFSDEITWAKPNPKIFHYTLEQLKVSPEEAAHIGDDRLTDVYGSKQAGMTSVWLAPQADEKLPDCDYHIRKLKELAEIFLPNANGEVQHGSR